MSDIRYYEPKRRNKNYGRFYASKGCVARCTFCHRFTKGIRYVPIDILERRLAEYVQRFNIGFVCFSDENFATHSKWLDPFLEMIAKFDLLWAVGGIRVNKINADLLKRMYDAGCTSVAYGTETGSPAMLAVMEKKVDIEDNYAITSITPEANLYYAPQMVIGMPGETSATIEESARFLEEVYTKDTFIHPSALQINYAQALPGTPLYEAGRLRRPEPDSLDAEEAYLMSISDKNARDVEATVNHTDAPYLIWKAWGHKLRVAAIHAYLRKFGFEEFILWHKLADREGFTVVRGRDGRSYFCDIRAAIAAIRNADGVLPAIQTIDKRLRDEAKQMRYSSTNKFLAHPILAYRFRHVFPLYIALRELRSAGVRLTVSRILDCLRHLAVSLKRRGASTGRDGISLRTATKDRTAAHSERDMIPLRLGR